MPTNVFIFFLYINNNSLVEGIAGHVLQLLVKRQFSSEFQLGNEKWLANIEVSLCVVSLTVRLQLWPRVRKFSVSNILIQMLINENLPVLQIFIEI